MKVDFVIPLSLWNLLFFIPSAVLLLLGIILSPSCFQKKPSSILHASAHLPA